MNERLLSDPISAKTPTELAPGSEEKLNSSELTGERWWLFFSGYDGSNDNRRAAVLAAISQSGASRDRVGNIFEPAEGKAAASQPCDLDISGTFRVVYASDDVQHAATPL